MKHLDVIPADLKGKALKEFIVKNEALIIHAKKSSVKECDAITSAGYFVNDKGVLVSKAMPGAPVISPDATKLQLDVCINTTNYFDSHYDVHIPGIWSKTIADNKSAGYYLLERHSSAFKDVIGEGLKGRVDKVGWKDLGFNYVGVTEALMFKGIILKDRNPFMFGQYAKGYVKQHSVGMIYVKMVTCINDDDYPVQKENWDKYFPMVVNQDDAEKAGIFWAVLEAKCNEGSAVLFGSNDMTPTQLCEEVKDASNSTEKGAATSTPGAAAKFDIYKAIKEAKF